MKWYSPRLAALLVLPLLSACAKEVENLNVITTPVGGTISLKVSTYDNGAPRPMETVSFTSKRLGAYKDDRNGYVIFLEEEAGQVKVQVMLRVVGELPSSELNKAQVILMPGKNGSQVVYDKKETYSSSVTKLVIGKVGEKVTGSFRFIVADANAVNSKDVYTIEGTFDCNRLPDSE